MKRCLFGYLLVFLLATTNVSATTWTWNSDYSNGLVASFTITPDVSFTDFNTYVNIPASQYIFVLGDQTHAPTQGVMACTFSTCNDDIGMRLVFDGWYWSTALNDYTYDEPYFRLNLPNHASAKGFVEINHQSDLLIWYTGFSYLRNTISVAGYEHSPLAPWGDNILTVPYEGGGHYRDRGQWDITGYTIPSIPSKPVPEPTTMLLLGLGLVGLAGMRRKFKK